ncbi:MAG: universal stress protein [Bacteroidia bacterium]|nr:universal stress protein [Bacteroidia bacterium]
MKKILVPCDFSDSAVQAFKFAVEIANQSDGEVLLLNIIEIPVMHDTVLMPTLSFEEAFLKDMKASAEKNFSKMIAKWAKEGPKVRSFVQYGPTSHVIRKFTTEKKIDLLVMGTKGATGFKEFFVGSNTEKIVRFSPVPVIAVKKSIKASSIKNIVFPNTLEDSVVQDELILKVKELQAFFKAKLHMIYINTPASFRKDSITRKKLADFAKRFLLKDFTLNVYNATDQETGVTDFVHEVGADMVAMATHGRRGLSHFFSGSVAEDIVNHIDCPIWTCVEK